LSQAHCWAVLLQSRHPCRVVNGLGASPFPRWLFEAVSRQLLIGRCEQNLSCGLFRGLDD
jgi:hypothetical protein